MKDLNLKGTNLVTQANNLIEARYSITKNEQLILSAMISFIDPNDKDFLIYRTSITQFAELLGLDKKNKLKEVKDISARLLSRVIEIETPNGWKMHQWVSYAEANYKEDSLMLRFHDNLKPFLLDLKTRFKSFKLSEIIEFKSIYSIRMYQLLRDFDGQRKTKFTYKLEDFRKIILGSTKKEVKKYPVFKNFRIRIIETAKKELDKKAQLSFTFETIRVGRSIGKIKFTIVKKPEKIEIIAPKKKKQPSQSKEEPVLAKMITIGVTKSVAKRLFEEFKADYIVVKIDLLLEDMKLGLVKNPAAYLVKAIKEDWTSEKIAQRKREEEKREKEKKERLEEYKKELLEVERQRLANDFKQRAIVDFLSSKSEEERDNLLVEIKNKNLFGDLINDLSSPMAVGEILNKIPYFVENQKKYIKQNLKT